MKTILFIPTLIFLIGCGSDYQKSADRSDRIFVQRNIDNLKYIQSSVTGLCFSTEGLDDRSMTSVECTPKVLEEIKRQNSL